MTELIKEGLVLNHKKDTEYCYRQLQVFGTTVRRRIHVCDSVMDVTDRLFGREDNDDVLVWMDHRAIPRCDWDRLLVIHCYTVRWALRE